MGTSGNAQSKCSVQSFELLCKLVQLTRIFPVTIDFSRFLELIYCLLFRAQGKLVRSRHSKEVKPLHSYFFFLPPIYPYVCTASSCSRTRYSKVQNQLVILTTGFVPAANNNSRPIMKFFCVSFSHHTQWTCVYFFSPTFFL